MKKKRGKKVRMVPYPVDQSLPLSVNVLIGEHTLVCVHKSLFVCLRESERASERKRESTSEGRGEHSWWWWWGGG